MILGQNIHYRKPELGNEEVDTVQGGPVSRFQFFVAFSDYIFEFWHGLNMEIIPNTFITLVR